MINPITSALLDAVAAPTLLDGDILSTISLILVALLSIAAIVLISRSIQNRKKDDGDDGAQGGSK